MSHTVEPTGHGLPRQDRGRLAKEDEEGGLKGVLGVVVVEEAPARPPHHRPVPLDERGEGGLIPPLDEATEELSVAQAGPVIQKRGPVNVLEDRPCPSLHVPPSACS